MKSKVIPSGDALAKFAIMFAVGAVAYEAVFKPIARQLPVIGQRLN